MKNAAETLKTMQNMENAVHQKIKAKEQKSQGFCIYFLVYNCFHVSAAFSNDIAHRSYRTDDSLETLAQILQPPRPTTTVSQ